MNVNRLPSACTVRSRTSAGFCGFHSGPKPLCTSVEMKLSHSISCQRAVVPKTGAIVPGFWSAMYCSRTPTSVSRVPSSSSSSGT